MQIRPIRPEEHHELARITVDAYRRADTGDRSFLSSDYEEELRDVPGRAAAAEVLVALDEAGTLLGGLTYIPPGPNPLSEHREPELASIRMLAVDAGAQGRGVGRALTEAAMDRARAAGAPGMILHSTWVMTTAHRLYERLGWVRDPSLDWEPEPGVDLWGFRICF